MPSLRRTLAGALLAVACAPATPPRTTPQIPALAPGSTASRVVLASFDGLGFDALARQTALPAFEWLANEGSVARVVPVDPTLTGPAHVSILTGASPQIHGIVANRFHVTGAPPEEETRGMMMEIDVETLVEAARRQGKRVGAVTFPTVDAQNDRRRADFGIVWPAPVAPARIIELTRADFRSEWVPPTWTPRPQRRPAFSPVMRARIEWRVPEQFAGDVDVVAFDTTDDGRENYDLYTIEEDDHQVTLDSKGWFALSAEQAGRLHGSWSKLLGTTPQLAVRIYWGAIYRTDAYPDSFGAMLDRDLGFWPGTPDGRPGVDPATFIEQLNRLSDFCTRAQVMAMRRMTFDLLLTYQPHIDEAAHEYLGSPEGDAVLRAAFQATDRAVATIAAELDLKGDALIVTGDHGLMVAQHRIALERLLVEQGFGSRWQAFASGSHAHLYRSGPPDDTEALIEMLTRTSYFERIERKNSRSHRHGGDVVVWSRPEIELTPSSQPPIVTQTEPHGHHGALNTHREIHTVFFAIGKGVPRGSLGEVRQTAIARFVSTLLGIAPPAAAE